MDWGGPGFVVALVALSTAGWIITTWIRARHGYAVENEWGGWYESSSKSFGMSAPPRMIAKNAMLNAHFAVAQ